MNRFMQCVQHSELYTGMVFALALVLTIALGACAPSAETSNPPPDDPPADTGITSGTIGGLGFTVISGMVFQDLADGPLAAGAGGGTILFDDATGILVSDGDNILVQVTARFEIGGTVVGAAHGFDTDSLAAAYAASVTRNSSSFDYELLNGLGGTPEFSGTLNPDPLDPTGTVYFSADFDSNNTRILVWPMDEQSPNTCNLAIDTSVSATGGGTRWGLAFGGAEISNVSVSDGFNGGC